MNDVLKINSNKTITITGETIDALLFHFKALQSDGSTVCAIADLNKISVEAKVIRRGRTVPQFIFNGFLDDILAVQTANSTRDEVFREARSDGYTIAISLGGVLRLGVGDKLQVKCKVQNTSFTSLSTTHSEVEFETVPSNGMPSVLNIVEMIPYEVGTTNVDENLGNNITKIVLCHDFTTHYDNSSKAKPVSGINLTATGFNKDVSENQVVLENNMAIQYSPSSNVKHLCIYDGKPISNAKLRASLNTGVDADAKIMVLKKMAV
ncbi:hypothetical protein [uncultured Winogradskyella sp.]|uniref:hypothetical protein n=1 Tax=uncultured Winogradskyella sp. TaxID=395353 RepID=UPI0026122565|nr:hypothetical protein [uncultured Winogradskyella sp.]